MGWLSPRSGHSLYSSSKLLHLITCDLISIAGPAFPGCLRWTSCLLFLNRRRPGLFAGKPYNSPVLPSTSILPGPCSKRSRHVLECVTAAAQALRHPPRRSSSEPASSSSAAVASASLGVFLDVRGPAEQQTTLIEILRIVRCLGPCIVDLGRDIMTLTEPPSAVVVRWTGAGEAMDVCRRALQADGQSCPQGAHFEAACAVC